MSRSGSNQGDDERGANVAPSARKNQPRVRLDQILVDRGLADSRTHAQALILAGSVRVERKHDVKAGMLLSSDTPLEVVDSATGRWAGRGGIKLAGALENFGMTQAIDGIWLDCGASTGGFTDVLLANGAKKVYAMDVGYGQIALKLRNDPRVVVIERFNIRNITKSVLPDPLDGVTLDLSFISSRLILPLLPPYLAPGGKVVLLFKPQFEGKRSDVGKGGIVRDEEKRGRIASDFESWVGRNGWLIEAKCVSSITGRDGNVEFFYMLKPM